MVGKRDFKRLTVSLAFIFLLFSLFFFPLIAQAQWEGAVVQRVTYNQFHDGMHSLVLSIDANDKLYSFYWEDITHVQGGPYKTFMITKEKGGEWSEPQVVGDTTYIIDYHCYDLPVIDPKTGIIHLIYDCGSKVYYTNSQRANWQKDILDSLPPNGHGYAWGGMVIDSFGNVHIAWSREYGFAGLNYFKVYYLTNATGEWIKQAISPDICTYFSGASGPWLSLQCNGVAHILYYSPIYINHAWNDTLAGTTWTTLPMPEPPVPFNWYGADDFKVDQNNKLHMLMYVSGLDRGYIFYYHKQNSQSPWEGPEQIYNLGTPSWLFVDKDGYAHAAGWRPSGIYYSNNTSGSWAEVYPIVDHSQYYTDLPFFFVIDSEGSGHAVFVGYYYPNFPYGLNYDSSEIYYLLGSPTFAPDASEEEKISKISLSQNYPNPFNSTTIIPYQINVEGQRSQGQVHTKLILYNIRGQKIRTLVNQSQPEGRYQVLWDGKDDKGKEVSSGVYFYVLKSGQYKLTKKMILLQ